MYPSAAAEETLKATIVKVRSYNDITGWFVGVTDAGHTVVGVSTPKPPVGTRLTLVGAWNDNPKWGRQFKVTNIKYDSMNGAILALLKSGFLKHIKESMADSVVRTLGEQTFDVLNAAFDGNHAALMKFRAIKGVGKVVGPEILASWGRNRDWAQNALIGIRAGLNLSQSKKASDKFGNQLKHIVYTNPYRLTVIRGITWEVVDRIAQETWPDKPAIDHDSPYRYAAAVREALSKAHSEGHICLPKIEAIATAVKIATPHNANLFEPTVRGIAEDEELKFVVLGGAEYIYTTESYGEESTIANKLRARSKRQIKPIDWNAVLGELYQFAPVDLSPDQLKAVETATRSPLMVMTGGPGTGKTTTVATMVNIFEHYDMSVTLCAPTGKAAVRMREATGHDAGTIHKTLGLPRETIDLDTDVVIVDEASMIDQQLFLELVKHVKSDRFILVGDADQLPPVGAGEPFFQIVQMDEIPVIRLETIHRQGKDSGIVHAAHAFVEGKVPDVSGYEDCVIERVESNEVLPLIAGAALDQLRASGVRQEDILMLTPFNRYEWGQHELNKRFKRAYNPGLLDVERMPAVGFDVGDPVIQTHNDYDLEVMNGEIGRVAYAMTRQQEIDAKEESDTMPVIIKVRYGERIVHYTREDIVDLKLAYSITIHKSQGSEAPYVILLIPSTFEGFELRQLAYTGLTRAKKFVRVFSCKNSLQRYVGNTRRIRRYTNLAAMM